MYFNRMYTRALLTVLFANLVVGSFFDDKINADMDLEDAQVIFQKLFRETTLRFARRSEAEGGKYGDKKIFIPDVSADAREQFLNDAYYWHQTFTSPVGNFESQDDQRNAISSLNMLMRLNFLCLRYGVLWSHLENDAMIYAQNPEFEGVYVKTWNFPFGALFSHGGRVNIVIHNDKNPNRDWLMAELSRKSYLNGDVEKIRLEQRDWSSHGFDVSRERDIRGNAAHYLIETIGLSVSSTNYSKEKTLRKVLERIRTGKLENVSDVDDVLNITKREPKTGLHYFIFAPFGGAGNVIKSSAGQDAVATSIDRLDNDPAAAHIFFRLNLEHHLDITTPRSIMVGIENSPPGRQSASGQAHNIRSVTNRNGRSAAAMGAKWKSLESNILGKGKPFLGVPAESGGKVITLNARRSDIEKLFTEADRFVAALQQGNEKASEELWNLLLSEHELHRVGIAMKLGIDSRFMRVADLVVNLTTKHRDSKYADDWHSTCFYDEFDPHSQKRLKENMSKCKAIFKSGMEYVFHYVEWLHGDKDNLLIGAQNAYFKKVMHEYKKDPTKNIPYFTAYKTIVLYFGLTIIDARATMLELKITDTTFINEFVNIRLLNLSYYMNSVLEPELKSRIFEKAFNEVLLKVHTYIQGKEDGYNTAKAIATFLKKKFKLFIHTANFLFEKSISRITTDEYSIWGDDQDNNSMAAVYDEDDDTSDPNIWFLVGQSDIVDDEDQTMSLEQILKDYHSNEDDDVKDNDHVEEMVPSKLHNHNEESFQQIEENLAELLPEPDSDLKKEQEMEDLFGQSIADDETQASINDKLSEGDENNLAAFEASPRSKRRFAITKQQIIDLQKEIESSILQDLNVTDKRILI